MNGKGTNKSILIPHEVTARTVKVIFHQLKTQVLLDVFHWCFQKQTLAFCLPTGPMSVFIFPTMKIEMRTSLAASPRLSLFVFYILPVMYLHFFLTTHTVEPLLLLGNTSLIRDINCSWYLETCRHEDNTHSCWMCPYQGAPAHSGDRLLQQEALLCTAAH